MAADLAKQGEIDEIEKPEAQPALVSAGAPRRRRLRGGRGGLQINGPRGSLPALAALLAVAPVRAMPSRGATIRAPFRLERRAAFCYECGRPSGRCREHA